MPSGSGGRTSGQALWLTGAKCGSLEQDLRRLGRDSHIEHFGSGEIAGYQALTEAVAQLKSTGQFAEVLSGSSAAGRLIETLSSLQEKQFDQKVERYQASADSSEVQRLRDEISRELFGP